jgi:hypothetical protein
MDQQELQLIRRSHVMPWHFKAEDAENGRDCVLIATMLGDEMQTISLHAGHLPDILPTAL